MSALLPLVVLLVPAVTAVPLVSACFLVLPEPRLRSAFSFLFAVVPVLLVNVETGACIEVGVPPVSAVFRTHIASMVESEAKS